MSSARAEILARVRAALVSPGTHHPRHDAPPRTTVGMAVPTERNAVLDLFAERVADYRAVVERAAAEDVPFLVVRAVTDRLGHGGSVVVPDGLDPRWVTGFEATGVDVRHERTLASAKSVEGVAAVVTTATVGVATTGTIVLDHGPGQGARALSLLPDLHVCVIRADQIVPDVPEATARLRPSIEAGRPLTWISGPSATSDIELDRVEGVHGPRTLHVVLID